MVSKLTKILMILICVSTCVASSEKELAVSTGDTINEKSADEKIDDEEIDEKLLFVNDINQQIFSRLNYNLQLDEEIVDEEIQSELYRGPPKTMNKPMKDHYDDRKKYNLHKDMYDLTNTKTTPLLFGYCSMNENRSETREPRRGRSDNERGDWNDYAKDIVSFMEKQKLHEPTYFQLMNANIKSDGVIIIAQNYRILEGFLSIGNDIGVKGAAAIASNVMTKDKDNFNGLTIYNGNIGDSGVKKIADSFKDTKNLTDLVLCGNNISDEGAEYIAKNLQNCPNMKYIYLNSNEIGGTGACILVAALFSFSNSKTGISLQLTNNNITTKGFKNIMSILQKRSHHETFALHLQDNEKIQLSAEDVEQFSKLSNVEIWLNFKNLDESAIELHNSMESNKAISAIKIII